MEASFKMRAKWRKKRVRRLKRKRRKMRARSLRKSSSGKDIYEARNGSCWSRLGFTLRDHVQRLSPPV
ncbi:hypothetical protein E4U42_004328 [Claviceps africana]|uniref:60S ribosomal protein L41 n=1 Tax=Claviceps africana TaxID=83212 RepID=A0A8K0J5G2_9HYPO|nr:hypothetical protein E4U42_004328 [Claviceps africana]